MSTADLQSALDRARKGGASVDEVRALLFDADVFIPKPVTPANAGEAEAQGEQHLDLPVVTGLDGRRFVPIFSSEERLAERAPPNAPFLRVPFRALVPGWPGDVHAVVDPGLPSQVVVPADLVSQEGLVTVPRGTRVFVGDPAEEPESLLRGLAARCEEAAGVSAAYRAQVLIDAPGEEPHLAFGFVLDAATPPGRIIDAARSEAETQGHRLVDFLVIDTQEPDAVAEHMLANTRPFYERV